MGFTYEGANSDAVAARRGPPRRTPRASSGRALPKEARGDVTGVRREAALRDKMLRGEERVLQPSGAQPS